MNSDSYRDALNKAASVVRKLAMERDEIGADADIRAALLHAVCEIEALPSPTPESLPSWTKVENGFQGVLDFCGTKEAQRVEPDGAVFFIGSDLNFYALKLPSLPTATPTPEGKA